RPPSELRPPCAHHRTEDSGRAPTGRALAWRRRRPLARHGRGPNRATGRLLMTEQKKSAAEPKLLSGGNPQIPKGEGPGPVRDYIAAMPGWKQDVGRRLDALIADTVPDVRTAVKWNQPFYGAGDEGWFLSFRC